MNIFENDKIKPNESVQYAALKYRIIAQATENKPLDEINAQGKMSEETFKKIRNVMRKPYTDSLIVMFGAGLLSEEALIQILHRNSDLSDSFERDVSEIEELLFSKSEDNEIKIVQENLQDIILLCANSKAYTELTPINVYEAVRCYNLPHVEIKGGFVRTYKKELLEYLIKNGVKFGFLDNNEITGEDSADSITSISEYTKEEKEKFGSQIPFALDIERFYAYSFIFGKKHIDDFLRYVKENNIPADMRFSDEYERYIKNCRMRFEITSYKRKRHICGDKINWFDYADISEYVSDSEKTLLAQNTKVRDFSDIAGYEDYTEDELLKEAVMWYKTGRVIPYETVIEVFHCGKEYFYYVDEKNNPIQLDTEEFHSILFDFNTLWEEMRRLIENKEIKVNKGRIILPQSAWDNISVSDQLYFKRLIEEQYVLNSKRESTNTVIKTLTELKKEAAEKFAGAKAEKEQQAAEEAAKKATFAKNRAAQRPVVEEGGTT